MAPFKDRFKAAYYVPPPPPPDSPSRDSGSKNFFRPSLRVLVVLGFGVFLGFLGSFGGLGF